MLEYTSVFLGRDVIEVEARPDGCVIDELSGMLSKGVKQSGHAIKLVNIGDLTHVAADDGFNIAFIPVLSAPPVATG